MALAQQEKERQERRCLANPSLTMQAVSPLAGHADSQRSCLKFRIHVAKMLYVRGHLEVMQSTRYGIAYPLSLHMLAQYLGLCLQVQECLDSLAAGKKWNPARRQQFLEEGEGAGAEVRTYLLHGTCNVVLMS